MSKRRVLGLFLFSCAVIAGLYLGTKLMIGQPADWGYGRNRQDISNEAGNEDGKPVDQAVDDEDDKRPEQSPDSTTDDEWHYPDNPAANPQDPAGEPLNPEDTGSSENTEEQTGGEVAEGSDSDSRKPDSQGNEETPAVDEADEGQTGSGEASGADNDNNGDTETISEEIIEFPDLNLIYDSTQVDYMKYIPEIIYDSRIESDLDIDNPSLDIRAVSAILFDANTGKVLYYKEPLVPVFPASTSKLLTALVVLDWCMEEEEVVVGEEIKMTAPDSTLAGLRKGQILSVRNALEGMLVPSGNDAAYVLAAYVGRKSLQNSDASLKEAIPEFIRLMNEKAKSLGALNSVFKTPDGYDAIGQYTTAYDMGLIGMAAANNETIVEICSKATARNVFVDGFDVTWNNTNSLVIMESGRYYPYCIGLKTGTSTMAGRCLISAARKDGKQVISVVMNTDAAGRWEDSTALLKYGLDN